MTLSGIKSDFAKSPIIAFSISISDFPQGVAAVVKGNLVNFSYLPVATKKNYPFCQRNIFSTQRL